MGTPNRFTIYLGGVLVASAWSLHAAHQKITAAVLLRAQQRGMFPVEAHIHNSQGVQIAMRRFDAFMTSEDDSEGEEL